MTRSIWASALVVSAVLVPMVGQAQEAEPEPLQQRYQAVVDTLVARLGLPDSTATQFRAAIATYLQETEDIFAAQPANPDRGSMEATSKAVAEARSRMNEALDEILTPEQITQATEIMEGLRKRAQEDASGG